MSRLDLIKELKKINVAIDRRILAGKKYVALARRHNVIVKLLSQN